MDWIEYGERVFLYLDNENNSYWSALDDLSYDLYMTRRTFDNRKMYRI